MNLRGYSTLLGKSQIKSHTVYHYIQSRSTQNVHADSMLVLVKDARTIISRSHARLPQKGCANLQERETSHSTRSVVVRHLCEFHRSSYISKSSCNNARGHCTVITMQPYGVHKKICGILQQLHKYRKVNEHAENLDLGVALALRPSDFVGGDCRMIP